MSNMGHNSGQTDDTFDVSDEQLGMANESADELRRLIERIERLEDEKKGIADDIKDIYSEGKAKGYDTKMMRKIVALRKLDPEARREQQAILETYLAALGMD